MNFSLKRKYIIYCGRETMIKSQKWFRHIYISKINIYFNKESQELHYSVKKNIITNIKNNKYKKNKTVNLDEQIKSTGTFKIIKKYKRKNSSLFGEFNIKYADFFKAINNLNNTEKKSHILELEIYSPVEKEEYFIQNINDPFPLLRTHKFNSFIPKIKQYIYNLLHIDYYDSKINLDLVGKLLLLKTTNEKEEKAMIDKFEISRKMYGYDDEINRFVKILI